MKAATVKELKLELNTRNRNELLEICLRLSKFKKENKELLTYLLYESIDENSYIASVKNEIDELFSQVNRSSFYYIKKSIRKILSTTKKYIRYSQKKQTEVELLVYFCKKLRLFKPSIKRSLAMKNLYNRQIETILKTMNALHEDLQFDYEDDIIEIKDF